MATTTAQKLLLEGETKAILTILRTKFAEIPEEVENAIRQMTDPIAIESLTVHAVHSKTLNEFVTALQ